VRRISGAYEGGGAHFEDGLGVLRMLRVSEWMLVDEAMERWSRCFKRPG
jgi:hypothetical protein